MNEIDEIVKRVEELRESDRIADAEDLVRDSLERYEDSWQLWCQLGHILTRKQEYEDAADAFQNAAEIEPDEFWPWLYLGHAQRDLENYEAAIEATENALSVEIGDKEFSLAYYNLACYNALLGRKQEAMDYLTAALETDKSLKEWVREDSDLDSLHDESGFEYLSDF